MLQKLLFTLSIVAASAGLMLGQNESAIKVKLTDKANKETIPFANVIVEMGGMQAGVGTTNIDGEATIKPLSPGKYSVKATYVGYQTVIIADIIVATGKTVYLNLQMSNTGGIDLGPVEIAVWKKPLIDPNIASETTVDREQYDHMASKDINSVAATTAGIYQNGDGDLNMRGARTDGTSYYVDGVKVIGSPGVPQGSVDQITTIVGGTPAEYGDATGGVIAITTRGPASTYGGGIELITSGLGEKNGKSRGLDSYGYNNVGFTLSGPLLTKKDSSNNVKKSVIGFFLSGEVSTAQDPKPSAVGMYQVKPDVLTSLQNTPLRPNPNGAGGFVNNAEFITMDDLQKIKARNNVRSNSILLNGKIQYQPTANLGITVGGSVNYNNYHDFIYEYALFTPGNNPQVINTTWRTYAKLTQKFNSATAKEEEKSSSNITNAYFTLQGSYSKTTQTVQDDSYKNKIFDYGYIGQFDQTKTVTLQDYTPVGTGANTVFYQNGITDTKLTFTPSNINPAEVAYTNQFYAGKDPNTIHSLYDVQGGLGLMNGDRPTNVYGLWYNTGRQYGGYSLSDQSQFRVNASFSADIKKHAVQVGFEFEQRSESAFALNQSYTSLWTQMRALTNEHLTQLDTAHPHLNTVLSGTYSYYDYDRLNDGTQTQFDRTLRTALGYNVNSTNWINVDALTPDQIQSFGGLKMFSADDLLNLSGNALVSYHGYDYTGAKISGKPTLDDFFTKKDANGNFTRQIGAYQPIYVAGYIQDKFDFKDVKFNIGLRIDRFDANQMVLKDKFLLYDAKTAGEVNFASEFNTTKPANIGDDYVVYVNDKNNPTKVVGYRNGTTWYNAQGAEVSDPTSSLGGANTVDGAVNPYLLDPAAAKNRVISSKVFESYTPQVNFMPRIAFSFPISDVADFFAHYDVLTQRPPGANRLDPMQYLTITSNAGQFINNPNLKPERTTDYELGFRQVLNEKKNSAISLSAFYRELRNMIQVVQVVDAFPNSYNSYDNIDFGTVKGFSIAYDLRRMASGVQVNANYTLSFADGTGSSATDGVNLVAVGQPNLRTTHPLDYDQRHTVIVNVDYRFGAGKDYNGPIWTRYKGSDKEKSIKILENIGANIVARAGSGTPYSRQKNITQGDPTSQNVVIGVAQRSSLAGMVNGSNLPWNFKLDLKIDKDILLSWSGKDGAEKKHANLNIYLQVLNVLNAVNILNVYKATGNPGDDGYLASADGQNALASKNSPASFTDLYTIKVNDPNYYSQPRVIRLGLMLDF